MTSYVKPARLHVRVWLLLSYLVLAPLSAFAISSVDASRLPFRIDQDGNRFIYSSVDGKNFTKNVLFTGAGVAHNAPILEAEAKLPFTHKGDLKASVKWPVDPKKVTAAASKAAGAAAAGASTGNGYLILASVACSFVCAPLVAALREWEVDQLTLGDDGGLSVDAPDPDAPFYPSSGSLYRFSTGITAGTSYMRGVASAFDYVQACSAYFRSLEFKDFKPLSYSINGFGKCVISYVNWTGSGTDSFTPSHTESVVSACPAGTPVYDADCSSKAPTSSQSLESYLQSNYTGKGWSRTWADITAGLVADGVNVFTDGTGTTITGPAVVPVAYTETKTLVNVVPGTTTPVSPGHTGATEPGTKVTTSTQTAKPLYSPGTSTSKPSITVTTETTTETKVINNATKVESTPVVEGVTETDATPPTEKPDHCEKNADTLGCIEVDVPDGEIPETTIELDYEYESLFGNGSCPASNAVSFFGQQVHVVDMPAVCDMVQSWLQPFVLASAFLVAMMIFAGGIRS